MCVRIYVDKYVRMFILMYTTVFFYVCCEYRSLYICMYVYMCVYMSMCILVYLLLNVCITNM